MPLNVRLELNTLRIRKKPSSFPFSGNIAAQPYLWVVFFKIDDANGSGNPIATIVGAPGSHGNLGIGSVTAPDEIRVPKSIGLWETGLHRLPPRQGTANELLGAIVGVVAILMEEDNVSDSGAEAGRAELIRQVQQVLDGIADNLAAALTFDSEAFATEVRSKITSAIRAQQNFLENIWSFINKDDFIGSTVWHTRYDELADDAAPQSITALWEGDVVDWDLMGRAGEFTESRPRFSRTSLNFGSVQAGLVSRRSITITNFTPRDPLALTFTHSGSQRFHLGATEAEIPGGKQFGFEVTFMPTGPGSESASVVVRRRGSNGAFATISLSGSTPAGPAP